MSYASFLLENIPLFGSLKPDDYIDLAGLTKAKNYKKGEAIFRQEDPGSTLYVIISGQIKISMDSADGGEIILAVLSDGDFFGELSLLDQEPRSANAEAMTDTRTIVLHRRDFLSFLNTHTDLAVGMLAALSHRLREADSSIQDAFYLNLSARLAKRLLELGQKHGVGTDRGLEIGLRLTQQDLAEMVGASRFAVNKQLKVFKSEGLIDMGKQRITIARPEKLGEYTYFPVKM